MTKSYKIPPKSCSPSAPEHAHVDKNVSQCITVNCASPAAPAPCADPCDTKCEYKFNPYFTHPRIIEPSKLKSMLDADTDKKVVLAAVPFWPQNAFSYYHEELIELGSTNLAPTAHTRQTDYLEYTTGGRTYESIQFDYRKDLGDANVPVRYYTVPSKEDFQQTLRNKGITKDHIIVVYDDTEVAGSIGASATKFGLNRMAARAMFVLQFYGHENVFLVNGGDRAVLEAGLGFTTNSGNAHAKWVDGPLFGTAAGENVATAPLSAADLTGPTGMWVRVDEGNTGPSDYLITTVKDELIVDREGVALGRKDCKTDVLDARPYTMYVGSRQGGLIQCLSDAPVRRLGHIKDAVNSQWSGYLEVVASGSTGPDYTRFKSPEDLLEQLRSDAGLLEECDRRIITACNEGIHAVMAWLVIAYILNYPNTVVYEGSTAEWADATGVFNPGNPAGCGVLIPQGVEGFPMQSGLDE